jgi:type II secretory pathway component PulK
MNRRRGLVLIIVLIVIVFLSLGAYTFSDLMITHHKAAQLAGRQLQTRYLVDSGVDYVKLFLAKTEEERIDAGGVFDNPDAFRCRTVIVDDDPNRRGSFAVISPNLDSDGNLTGTRHGLEDESTRLNLNVLPTIEQTIPGAGATLLMALPGMTEDVADAILDWLDSDDEERELGAETGYYSGLSPSYAAKNGPLETVEELLLVRGVTPELLFGSDVNRNGMIDEHEAGSDGPGALGWSAYLTLYSMENNLRPDGQPRINLNESDLTALSEQLAEVFPAEWVTFILAYRLFGPYTGMDEGEQGLTGTFDLMQQPRGTFTTVLDLVGAKVQATFTGENEQVIIASPIAEDLASMAIGFPLLMDNVTVNPATTIPGRININQASASVLSGIPGINEEIVSTILSSREYDSGGDRPNHNHETWLLVEGIVTLAEMKQLMPFVTGSGDVYRAQVVGYFQGGEASSRAEAVFDATTTTPRLLFWRDISHLGRGYAVETLGVDFSEASP